MRPNQITVGQHIRTHVVPAGMSVTEAAKRLGVGRPALSNLLNGRASLTPKMATRLERAFGADRDALLQLQAEQDRERTRDEEKAVAVRGYVPRSLGTIKAQQISQGADNVNARSLLPVLLRRLVHGTGRDLRRVDFPGFDNSERPGWDGWVEADAATAWIPQGASGWEFGTSQRPRQKAESDYAKRLQLPIAERELCAFIFVTPRNWPGKDEWVKEKGAGNDGWREVRAYDASDLEQWLEESVATPVWLAEQLLPTPIPGVRTLEACWAEWAGASEPPMTEHLFQPSVDACVGSFKQWLGKAPEGPYVVAADSKAEALAFLRCLFRHDDIQGKYGDQAAVFDSPDTLTALAASSAPFIPIAANAETQVRLPLQRTHCIALCPRNAANVKAGFALKLLGDSAFAEGLKGMGFDRHDVDRLARESGRSPTVLRRRLATVPAIRTPQWAGDAQLAGWLMPMCLVGAWHSHSKADQGVISDLAECGYGDVERHVVELRQLEDSPVWSVGQYRGVTSKIDALFAIADLMTEANICGFLSVAEAVLSEPDPSLDLPETTRWLAPVQGKVRRHSDALRDGILETLVLLAVHGNHLFQERLGVDIEAMVSALVGRLLTPLAERLLSQERDLPSYAEAAPQKMLQILEDDLKSDTPVVLQLLKPTGNLPFEHCSRTGLLWAIECMAWNPEHLSRTCTLLARLSQVEIVDRWANKPIESLVGILRSWMPQTAASLDERIKILSALNQRFPEIGWQLCLGEIETHRIAMDNYRPRWRSDAEGAGGVATKHDAVGFISHAVSLMLSRSRYDQRSLGDLVENMDALPRDRRPEVWDRIEAWAEQAEESAIADLRERIRSCALERVGRRIHDSKAVERARLTYERLLPSTPNIRHAWLFANAWIRVSLAGEKDEIDVKANDRRVDGLRQAAMEEIWTKQGLDGVLAMIGRGSDPWTLGRYAAVCAADAAVVLRACLVSDLEDSKVDAFMGAFILGCVEPAESDLLLNFAKQIDIEQAVRLMACAPFRKATWRVVDRLSDQVKAGYWRKASPLNWRLDDAELGEAAESLLAAKRPQAAFHAVMFRLESVETALLMHLLKEIVAGGAEAQPSLDSWYVSRALDLLDACPGVTVAEVAQLEYAFLDVLHRSEHGVPNIERLIEDSPAFFVEILMHCSKRGDRRADPFERQVESEEHRRALANKGYELLHRIARVPGTKDDGSLDRDTLLRWVKETRRLCAEVGRTSIGDTQIGDLLANAPADADDAWPHRAVCEALEAVATEDVARGFGVGKYNKYNLYSEFVGDGGDMERDLAAEYRRWAQRRRVEYPFVGRVLEEMAGFYEQDAEREDRRDTLSKRLNTWV